MKAYGHTDRYDIHLNRRHSWLDGKIPTSHPWSKGRRAKAKLRRAERKAARQAAHIECRSEER